MTNPEPVERDAHALLEAPRLAQAPICLTHEDAPVIVVDHIDSYDEASSEEGGFAVEETDFEESEGSTLGLEIDADLEARVAAVKDDLIQLGLYMVFLGVFILLMTLTRNPRHSFLLNEVMKDIILHEEFSYEDSHIQKTFFDVATTSEFWQFVEGPLLRGLFDPQGSAPNPNLPNLTGKIYGTQRLVGAVRIRQMRVQHDPTCDGIDASFASFAGGCYPAYQNDVADTADYGWNGTIFHYAKTGMRSSQGRTGSTYDGDGFVQDLGLDLHENAELLTGLRDSHWIDLNTRAVYIDFTTYNANVNLFCVVQLTFEWLPGGGTHPGYEFTILNLLRYDGDSGLFVLVLDILLLIFLCYYTLQEARELKTGGVEEYLAKDFWNYLDLATYFMLYCAVIVHLIKRASFSEQAIDQSDLMYNHELQLAAYYQRIETLINAINAILLFLRILKYTKFSRRTYLIVAVLEEAAIDVLVFILILSSIMFGFALGGFLIFGHDVAGFYDPVRAFISLFQMAIGDFGLLEDLTYSNRHLGPLFIVVYSICVVLIVLSMFLAIVSEGFRVVAHRFSTTPPDTAHIVLRDRVRYKCAKLFRCRKRRNYEDVDANKDGQWDRGELSDVLRNHPAILRAMETKDIHLSPKIVEKVLTEFDKDGDGQLGQDEQKQLIRALEEKDRRMQALKRMETKQSLLDKRLEERRAKGRLTALDIAASARRERFTETPTGIAAMGRRGSIRPDVRTLAAGRLKMIERLFRDRFKQVVRLAIQQRRGMCSRCTTCSCKNLPDELLRIINGVSMSNSVSSAGGLGRTALGLPGEQRIILMQLRQILEDEVAPSSEEGTPPASFLAPPPGHTRQSGQATGQTGGQVTGQVTEQAPEYGALCPRQGAPPLPAAELQAILAEEGALVPAAVLQNILDEEVSPTEESVDY